MKAGLFILWNENKKAMIFFVVATLWSYVAMKQHQAVIGQYP